MKVYFGGKGRLVVGGVEHLPGNTIEMSADTFEKLKNDRMLELTAVTKTDPAKKAKDDEPDGESLTPPGDGQTTPNQEE